MPSVLVTGSSRGIGSTLARAFGRAGYKVLVHYHAQADKARAVAADITAAGGEAVVYGCDIADPAAVRAMVDQIAAAEGALDVLVNNAALTRDRTILKMTDEEWNTVIDADLSGTFHMTRACAALMAKRRAGAIVNIASIVGARGSHGNANYAAAKAGVIGLTKAAARELGRFSIRVNAVLPGYHATDMGNTVPADYVEAIKRESVLGCTTDMEELARFVVLLAATATVSGQVFNWDSRVL